MSVHSISLRTAASFESATSRLTEMILGAVEQNLAETLRVIAAEIGLCHIAYLRLSPDKSADISLLVAVVTYSRLWRHRYFVKKYIVNDPVIQYGRHAAQPFDWENLPTDDLATKTFFADALNHSVGRNGLSIPLRNRRGVFALVSFTSDLPKVEWEAYKTGNMRGLQLLSVLIDSAANINFKYRPFRFSCRSARSSVCCGRREERPIKRSRKSWVWPLAA